MNIAGAGYTGYTSYLPGVMPANSPAAGSGMQNSPVAAPPEPAGQNSPAAAPVGQNAPFAMPVTPQVLPPLMLPDFSMQAFPVSNNPGQNTLFFSPDGDTVELSPPVESGLLDKLKPDGECQTCANRKYVDNSDDPSVSYQTPTKISSSMSAAAVTSHEQEHVRNEQADAAREDRQVVSQTVTLQYACCPECGKTYVSGGTTRTMTTGRNDSQPFDNDAKTPQSQPSAETE